MAKPKHPKPEPGKKSLPWYDDPEILRRLAQVEDLVLSGYRNTEIAKHLDVTEATIRRDRDRIAELWRKHSTNDIVGMRERSIANLRRIQRLADNDFRRALEDEDLKTMKPAYLRVQMDAEKEIIRLQGTSQPVEIPIKISADADKKTLSTEDLLKRKEELESLAMQLLNEESGFDQEDIHLGG